MKFIKKLIFIIVLAVTMTLYACNGGAYTYSLSNTNEKTKVEKVYILYPFGSYRLSHIDGNAYIYEIGSYKIDGESIKFNPKKNDSYAGQIKDGKIEVKGQKYSKM